MKSMSKTRKVNEQGIVAIFVTMILMLVITLIVIGFSQVARRNQREALDRQLSTQAYYAAESGVNAAAKYFSGNPGSQIDTLTGGDCTDATLPITVPIPISSGISTPCLMVNAQPASLVANPVTQDSNIVWHVQDAGGSTYNGLTFTWAADGGSNATSCTTVANHPSHDTWNCKFAILRVDIVPAGTGNLGSLNSNTAKTVFMTPTSAASGPLTTGTTAIPNAVNVVGTTCSTTTNQCSVKILAAGLGASEYYVRITTLYQDSASVSLTSTTVLQPTGGAKFKDGQAIIDSTGQAQDERRRIQVRIPLVRAEDNLPLFGVVSTQSVCKQLNVLANVNPTGCY